MSPAAATLLSPPTSADQVGPVKSIIELPLLCQSRSFVGKASSVHQDPSLVRLGKSIWGWKKFSAASVSCLSLRGAPGCIQWFKKHNCFLCYLSCPSLLKPTGGIACRKNGWFWRELFTFPCTTILVSSNLLLQIQSKFYFCFDAVSFRITVTTCLEISLCWGSLVYLIYFYSHPIYCNFSVVMKLWRMIL